MSMYVSNKLRGIRRQARLSRLRHKRRRKFREKREREEHERREAMMTERQKRYRQMRNYQRGQRRLFDEGYDIHSTALLAMHEPIPLAAIAPYDGDYRIGQVNLPMHSHFGVDEFEALDVPVFNHIGDVANEFPIVI